MLRRLVSVIHAVFLGTIVANALYLRAGRRRRGTGSPRVSVLVPARNEAANLRRLLPSLLAQRYPDFEVVVYDDGSDDGTGDVARSFGDPRLRVLRGEGPPPGWIGKVHALYEATRAADGTLYLFLDADAELLDPDALGRLVGRFLGLRSRSVLTGLTRLLGDGRLLVSLVPNAILGGLPWPLVRPLPMRSLGALNGQCWLIRREDYHRYEPHRHVRDAVLEDVEIGRYLKGRGLVPALVDVQDEVAIHMYTGFADAWRGFRKNAYLIMGGRPASFAIFFAYFGLGFVFAPLLGLRYALGVLLLKGATDRLGRFPFGVTLLAPVSYVLGWILQLDSAVAHWTGRVAWKGRSVGAAPGARRIDGPR